MYSKNQLVAVAFLLASLGLSLPMNPITTDIEARIAGADTSNLEITKIVPYLETRDNDYPDVEAQDQDDLEELEARDEEESDMEAQDDDEQFTELESRANDPYGGKYAPSESQRKQELTNTHEGLSPDGKTGKQVAKQAGLKYDGDSGKKEYLEVANGGPLPEKCGKGCENSIYSKSSKNSQISKAHKAGDTSSPYGN